MPLSLPPLPPILISPGDTAVGVSVNPTFSWGEETSGCTFDLQVLDGATIVKNIQGISGTSYSLTGLSYSKSYTWRVRAVNYTGTSDWSSASFTTQSLPAPNPVPYVNVSFPSSAVRPEISWGSASYASYYHIKISKNMQTLYDQDVAGLSFSVPSDLYYETDYDVTVTAVNSSGSSSGYTESFTTGNTPAVATPTSLSPASGTTNVVPTPVLAWVSSDTDFEIDIASDSQFTNIVESGTSNSNSYTVKSALSWSGTFYWRVRAKEVFNEGTLPKYSNWATSNFTVKPIPVPAAPNVSSVLDTDTNFTFSWDAVTYADHYHVTITRASDSVVVFDDSNVTALHVSLVSQYYEDTFNVSVVAINSSGSSVPGTASVNTGTFPTPAVPTSLQPASGTTDTVQSPTLSWTGNDSKYDYDIQIDNNSDFSSVVESGSATSGSYAVQTVLDWDTTYYWRVRAKESYNEGTKTKYSAWTIAHNFAVTVPVPSAPNPVASLLGPDYITVSWAMVPYADNYHVVITRASDGAVVADDTTAMGTYELPNQYFETTFNISVTAINRVGTSSAGTDTITTGNAPAVELPVLVSPANAATGQEPQPVLDWTSPDSEFEYEVASDAGFATIVDQGTVTTSQANVGTTLDWSTTYYWRVRAKHYYNEGTLLKFSDWVSGNFTVKPIPVPGDVADIIITFPTPTRPQFSWSAVTYADHYHIKITKP